MSDSSDPLAGFIPLDPATVRALENALVELERARAELEGATGALIELADDMKTDAVRRLAERGASAAQIERYEDAHRACAAAVRARSGALEAACASMRDAVRRVRE